MRLLQRSSHSPTVRPRTQGAVILVSIHVAQAAYGANEDVAVFWTWQSNSKCTEHCKDSGTFAFAVIQYKNCWCTNYIPSTTTDINSCQKDCPGWPDEKCGNKDDKLFIYIEMDGQPSGTAGGSRPSSTDVSSATPVPSTDSPSTSDAITVSTSMSHYIATA